jgi:uncharacterized membrane protein YqjE
MTTDGLPPHDDAAKSLGDIVADVSEKASQLVREEIELAKAEVTGKLSKLTKGAVVAGAASVFLVFGITMFFHTLAWLLNDLNNWDPWTGFAVVTALLFLLGALAGFVAFRLFKKGSPPTPDMAIAEARKTRAELEAQKIEHYLDHRRLERGEEVKT